MAADVSLEILDLRHFSAPQLRPLLEAESDVWRERLHWDYRASSRLLLQYMDTRMLPGYAALESGQIVGYTFCVYEDTKAVIGDLFALAGAETGTAHAVETTLLRHLLEMLVNSPQVDRIESQLLLHSSGTHAGSFQSAGFGLHPRIFMVQPLDVQRMPPRAVLPAPLELRGWREEDLHAASRLIAESYRDHPDSLINDQYHSVHGSLRFLHNIVHYAGCGAFSQMASHVIVDRTTRELAGLVLGSRVSPESGHVTQLCIHPDYRRRGMARLLLDSAAAQFLRQGVAEVSLTVTGANHDAIALYEAEGYVCRHRFDAAVWQRFEGA